MVSKGGTARVDKQESIFTEDALLDRLKLFLTNHRVGDEYKYVKMIDDMLPTNAKSITIDYDDVFLDTQLSDEFRGWPDKFLIQLREAVRQILIERDPEYEAHIAGRLGARIRGFPDVKKVREINSVNTGEFATIKAMLIRVSKVDSLPTAAIYKCGNDHLTKRIHADKSFILTPPLTCGTDKCRSRDLDIVPEESKFIDYQILQLQELPADLPPGKIPKNLSVFVAGDLVDGARMGDVVLVSGVIRPEIGMKIKLGREVQSYTHRLYANNVETLANESDGGGPITEDELAAINEVKKMGEKQATDAIVGSFGPNIYGHSLIKEAIILTLIGSDSVTLPDGKNVRGDINMFLVGDPSTAKSELGKYAYRVGVRSFYASGKGSSGVGLTAATIQDKTTGAYMLEPGVCVLADQGMAVLDEFDKMEFKDRSALHEVMEQQSVSISKGGITARLNARCSVIAIANPIYGRYDPMKNLNENIPSIPIPLLTRFDMIFIVRDVPDREEDEKIARHVINAHSNRQSGGDPLFGPSMFRKYLRVAKDVHPELSQDAADKIVDYYTQTRDIPEDEEGGMNITVRQMEGIIRMTKARAKFLLKGVADLSDAERAIHIMTEMFRTSGVDVKTGKVDMGVLEGNPKSAAAEIKLFQKLMKDMAGDNPEGVSHDELVQEMVATNKWNEASAEDFVKKMEKQQVIFQIAPNRYRTTYT